MYSEFYQRKAREVIEKVIQEHSGKKPAVIKQILDKSYPFGEEKGRPHRIWLQEVAKAEPELENMYYQRQARIAIERALETCAGRSVAAVRESLKAAYPFAQRSGRPYKVWLRELKRAESQLELSNGQLAG